MSAQVVKIKDFSYRGHNFETLWIILDDHNSPPLLPLLFTTYLERFGIVYKSVEISDETNRKRISLLEPSEIEGATIRSYINCLSNFLTYLDDYKINHQTLGIHASSACNESFVRDYLNNVLPDSLDSYQSLTVHQAALRAYFNWLDYLEIRPRLKLEIYRKTRQKMEDKCSKQHYIQYIARYRRTKLLNTCKTMAEKLIMRMGFEVGLRTSELTGLQIEGKYDLQKLFEQLDNDDYKSIEHFRYWLHGRFTKHKKSRWIYFSRALLIDMRRYFDTERRWIINQSKSDDSCFFLRTDPGFIGTGIGKTHGSNVFRNRADSAGLDSYYSFHDLRHTFATELYHSEITNPDNRETRSESAALLVVSQRLGHAIGKDGLAPAVTTKYIRLRIQMLEAERADNG